MKNGDSIGINLSDPYGTCNFIGEKFVDPNNIPREYVSAKRTKIE